jgi:2-dehydropantoate 2-reductase
MDSKIMIVGIGGVGGYLAALLTKKYDNVTLVARGERYKSLKENGLTLHNDLYGTLNQNVNVVEKASDASKQDYIFICVKNYSLSTVLKEIKPCIKEDTIIVPVMNGVDHGLKCEQTLDKGYVVDSLIYIVSSYQSDYSIKQVGDLAYLYVGGKNEEQNQAVCDLLNDAQIDCALAEDIDVQLWKKYILNCAFNVLTAFYDCTNTDIRSSKVRCNEYKELLTEAYTVAKAKGIDLDKNLVNQLYDNFMYNQPDGATSSLERDIRLNRPNELETFSGYLVKEADQFNLTLPQTRFFYKELKRKSI